jgi:hypothetical protein
MSGQIEALVMKGWMETRWRMLAGVGFALFFLFVNRGLAPRSFVMGLGVLLTICAGMLAGTGVKSQSPAGFPEGLAGSTQFTIALPVSRLKLLTVRAAIGMLEATVLALIVCCVAWNLSPLMRSAVAPSDFARLMAIAVLFMGPYYCSVTFCTTFLDEPLSGLFAGWSLATLLWLLHHGPATVDIVRALGEESPLITHRLPWTQMAAMAGVSLLLFCAAARVVQSREY